MDLAHCLLFEGHIFSEYAFPEAGPNMYQVFVLLFALKKIMSQNVYFGLFLIVLFCKVLLMLI
jgi:hypothetical protein